MSISKLIYSKIQFWGQINLKCRNMVQWARGMSLCEGEAKAARGVGPAALHTRYQFAFLFFKIIIRDKKVVEFLLKNKNKILIV